MQVVAEIIGAVVIVCLVMMGVRHVASHVVWRKSGEDNAKSSKSKPNAK